MTIIPTYGPRNASLAEQGHPITASFYIDSDEELTELATVDNEVRVGFDADGLPGPHVHIGIGDNVMFHVNLADLLEAIAKDAR